MQQGSGVLTSATTGQRNRPELGVRNRAMSSAPANHDHYVRVGEEPIHTFVKMVMYCVVIPGFQNGLHDLRVLANVLPHAPVDVGVVELSAVDRPCWAVFACSRVIVLEAVKELVAILLCTMFFVRSPEFVAAMCRSGTLLEVRESAAHDNSIGLEHISRNLATANIDHRMCETIGRIRLL